ncbi:hypothetical protein [Thermococcus sp.]|uniref:hypothetical protein n=1 Tax=Thermococcus sp. TaxID=35749 RepID=UPI002637E20E|nr:hypothetical protein [Thermococcus sp.]
MEDILVPRERRDAVVFIGVDRNDNVELVRVYALTEDKAEEALEEFFNARGLFPADYEVISRGWEELGERRAITTRSEEELSSALARLGLRLISNGVLLLENRRRIYQITLATERLRGAFSRRRDLMKVLLGLLDMGLSVLVENRRGVELSEIVPEGFILLREPSPGELVKALSSGKPVIIDTIEASRYLSFEIPAVVKLPPLSPEEFAGELSKRLGIAVPPRMLASYPRERLNLRNVEAVVRLVEAFKARGIPLEKAIVVALELNSSGP